MTDTTAAAPAFAERREQTITALRASILADAPKAAEAITAAVDRLGVVELLRAAVAIATLADIAAEDTDDSEPTGTG